MTREQARCALLSRYERDFASTEGQHRRFWKRVLRSRVKARLHRKKLVDDLRVRRGKNPNDILPPPRGDLPRWVDMRTAQWRPHTRKYNQDQRGRMARISAANRAARGKAPYQRAPQPQQSRSRSWTAWDPNRWCNWRWEQPWWSPENSWWRAAIGTVGLGRRAVHLHGRIALRRLELLGRPYWNKIAATASGE